MAVIACVAFISPDNVNTLSVWVLGSYREGEDGGAPQEGPNQSVSRLRSYTRYFTPKV